MTTHAHLACAFFSDSAPAPCGALVPLPLAADMRAHSTAHLQGGDSGTYPSTGRPEPDATTGVQRFALILHGTVQLSVDVGITGREGDAQRMAQSSSHTAGEWVFCPGTSKCHMQDVSGDAAMIVVERLPVVGHKAPNKVLHGKVQDSPALDTGAPRHACSDRISHAAVLQ